MLPPKIPRKAKRSDRWKSQAHCTFIRKHACSNCGSMSGIEVAHVRLGTHTGMGQKPDDFSAVSLCGDCHRRQHNIGESSFWRGKNLAGLIAAFIQASPRRREIEEVQRERRA